ncbi:hypothetical protein ABZ307_28530 [Streptomyces griseorubiginosus]|uniref:hypothetical protein n=1 Tax=Streptomyces griseorubiginosus TaxID=67304 RepID=UPI0033AFA4CA
MFVARDTEDDRLWFRLRDCAAYFGSLFCIGWESLGNLIRTDCTFIPTVKAAQHPFDHALVRDLGLVVLAEWNDPDVWLWMQRDDGPKETPKLLDDVYALVKEPHINYQGKLAGKAFAPAPEGWRCSRCGRFSSQISLTGRVEGVPLYSCAGREEAACLTS